MRGADYTETIQAALSYSVWARDDDLLLYQDVLTMLGCPPNNTVEEWLRLLRLGKVPSQDTVTRLRRMLQEQFPDLRGTKYEERHAREKVVKEQLGYRSKDVYVEELFERNRT